MKSDTTKPVLYGYWRSSSSYRVRIALNLKGVDYSDQPVHLVRGGGEQHSEAYRRINPLGLVPSLVHHGLVFTQSLAIMEYIEEAFPSPIWGQPLLPGDKADRAHVRSMAQSIACEIQPMNNLGVMRYLGDAMGADKASINAWYQHWIGRGFKALEKVLGSSGASGAFCHGERPGLADCCLVPQVYNAERFNCDLNAFPLINHIVTSCRALPEFVAAAPQNQPDAVSD